MTLRGGGCDPAGATRAFSDQAEVRENRRSSSPRVSRGEEAAEVAKKLRELADQVARLKD
jgi:hypothetical protein